MAGRTLPDLRPASRRELVAAWRERGYELTEAADRARRDDDAEYAAQLEEVANDYFFDADNLEVELAS